MANKNKELKINPIRHYDRCNTRTTFKFEPLIEVHTERVSEEYLDEKTQCIKRRFVEKVVSVDKTLKASDYKLENLLSIGALDKLNPCTLSYSSLGTIDGISKTLSNINTEE